MKNPDKIQLPTWCPGCGAYSVMAALNKAISVLGFKRKDLVICYDIGCNGNMVNHLDVCAVATLHGRSIPVACGIKSSNAKLKVIAQAGDGGLLSEGLNHFIHAIQRDDNITLIVNNNQVFALTAGQQSSATPRGVLARATSVENKNNPLSIVDLAATTGARFIARVHENNIDLMSHVIKEAIKFDGLSVVEIIQPCKIWAKKFPVGEFKKLARPAKNRLELIGHPENLGILYIEEAI